MDFEVYCDESHQDLLSKKDTNQFFLIGSLWLQTSLRLEIKNAISKLRQKHSAWGEIKWSKVSPSKKNFYLELIDLFIAHKDRLRFRCIVIKASDIDMSLHDNDKELGFYKFYYQLLHHWIFDFNTYKIFCDIKTNRDPFRLKTLLQCLRKANLTSEVKFIQALPSHEVALIQLTDFLLGLVAAKFNKKITSGTKLEIIEHMEQALHFNLTPTPLNEQKFNIFKIHLEGGW